ncbi:hypothetical protein L8N14_001495 [Serratia marcescens]|uniref:hypothetical protein n=1 Tax=Serratia marcescens TaxID=615 RepID=UPI001C942C43|nr:hypothetical protein [Serratia marcescens]MBY4850895.1 hypothetical protein [Serratia marcescens]MCH9864755.1 hypothetical protein [Serratia marcescens]
MTIIGAQNSGGGDSVAVDDISDAGETGKVVLKSASPDAAREVLDLGDAALKSVGTEAGNVMAVGAFGFGTSAVHKADAYTNTAQIYRVNATSANRPGNNVYGVISLPCDGSPTTGYLAVGSVADAYVGKSTTPGGGITWDKLVGSNVSMAVETGGRQFGIPFTISTSRFAMATYTFDLSIPNTAGGHVEITIYVNGAITAKERVAQPPSSATSSTAQSRTMTVFVPKGAPVVISTSAASGATVSLYRRQEVIF